MSNLKSQKFLDGAGKISKILAYLDVSSKKFAEKIGYSSGAIYEISKGNVRDISSEMADSIISVYPEFSRAWLLSGEGPMLRGESATTIGENNGINVQHGGNGNTYNNYAELMQLVVSQQHTIQDLAEQNKILTKIIEKFNNVKIL